MDYIDIRKLSLDELVGVVNLYPWFGGARQELCKRMAGEGWGDTQYADAALYVVSREKISDMMRSERKGDWVDLDVAKLLKSYISEKEAELKEDESKEKRRVYAGVGDYFSQEDYDQVRHSDDNVFSRYAAKAKEDKAIKQGDMSFEFDLYTETLAQIYAEQGYYEQAKAIYSKLILAYPEKNAYFAALIEKINGFISI